MRWNFRELIVGQPLPLPPRARVTYRSDEHILDWSASVELESVDD